MATLIKKDNHLHTIVSNFDKKKNEATFNEISGVVKRRDDILTFSEKPSIAAGNVKKPLAISKPGIVQLTDAAAGSYGNAKMLEVVIADDDRQQVMNVLENPWKKIAALRIKTKTVSVYAGTGWFISPTVVATAGHCVCLHDHGGWAQEIEVIPALNGSIEPFSSFKSRKFESSKGWIKERNSDYDYGVIILDQPIDPAIGWFSFAAPDNEYLKSNIANISGYPVDKDNATHQYYHARNISQASTRRLYYEIDTFGGQSGSPVWMNLGENERVVIGVHTAGSSTSNYGTRITEEVFKNLQTWKK